MQKCLGIVVLWEFRNFFGKLRVKCWTRGGESLECPQQIPFQEEVRHFSPQSQCDNITAAEWREKLWIWSCSYNGTRALACQARPAQWSEYLTCFSHQIFTFCCQIRRKYETTSTKWIPRQETLWHEMRSIMFWTPLFTNIVTRECPNRRPKKMGRLLACLWVVDWTNLFDIAHDYEDVFLKIKNSRFSRCSLQHAIVSLAPLVGTQSLEEEDRKNQQYGSRSVRLGLVPVWRGLAGGTTPHLGWAQGKWWNVATKVNSFVFGVEGGDTSHFHG